MVKTLGIDLGTTNTVVSYRERGQFHFLSFGQDTSLPSSMIYRQGHVEVGTMAVKRATVHSENYIKSSKTHLGDFNKSWQIEDRIFSPMDVATEILKKVKDEAIKKWGDQKFRVVITVPAYFNANQRDETKKAGIAAGFDVKQIITEPVAAAVAYGLEDQTNGLIYVVDIGGGTFDVAILRAGNSQFETLAIAGDHKLGGDDFDKIVLKCIIQEIKQQTNIDFQSTQSSHLKEDEYSKVYQKLLKAAEDTKKALSETATYDVKLFNIINGVNVSFTITRTEFEKEVALLLKRINKTLKECLTNAGLSIEAMDKIILVGGTSHIPAIQNFIQKEFGKAPYLDRDMGKLVAMGAAILSEDSIESISIHDIVAHSLGIEIQGQRFEKILPRGSSYPISIKKVFTTTLDYQEVVDIAIFEGENEDNVSDNFFYGSLTLPHIEKAEKGVPRIEVEFTFDSSQTLHVVASDLNTGSSVAQQLKVEKGVRRERPKANTCDIALLLDRSMSMGKAIEQAKEACLNLVDNMVDFSLHRMSLVIFDSTSTILTTLTNDQSKLRSEIKRISVTGTTDMTGAFENALTVLSGSTNRKIAIMVTDGEPDYAYIAEQRANDLKNAGAQLITIGVGNNIDENYLSRISTSPNDYHSIHTISQLADIFERITNALQTV